MSLPRFAKSFVSVLLICASVCAQTPVVVYEASTNYSGKFAQRSIEYGEEVVLFGNKTVLTQMQIEYFGAFVPNGDEVARVRIYENTGPVWMGNKDYPSPTSPPLWETTFPVHLGFNTATLTVPYVKVPLRFTWTVQFFGIAMTPTDHAGLLIYGDPIVGSSFDDFWELGPGGWNIWRATGVPKNNFAAKFMAVAAVPPPPNLSVVVEGGNLRTSWPVSATSYYLESRAAFGVGNWEPVTPLALRVGEFFQTTVPITSGNRIFRLNSAPQPPLLISVEAGTLRFRWSAAIGGMTLQSKTTLEGAVWTDVATPSRPVGNFYEVTAPADSAQRFYRLVRTI